MNWNMRKTAIVAVTLVVVGTISIADASAQLLRWRRARCCCPTQTNPCCATAHAGGYGMASAQPGYSSGYTVANVGCGPAATVPGTVYRSTGPVYSPTMTPNQTWTTQPSPANGQFDNRQHNQNPAPIDNLNQNREEFAPPSNPDQRNDVEPVPEKSGG